MKQIIAVMALLIAVLMPASLSAEPREITYPDWPDSCPVPYGYTARCGYYASNVGGECLCREGDIETTLCMKSTAPGGCGLFELTDEDCCIASSGF